VNFTNDQRIKIFQRSKSTPKLSQKQLAEWAKVQFTLQKIPAQSSISDAISKAKVLANLDSEIHAKKHRAVNFPLLEKALANWVLQCQSRNVKLKGDLIVEKAKKLLILSGVDEKDHPKFSNGWLEKFQKRNKFKSIKSYGESGSVNMDIVETGRTKLKEITSKYERKNIFNMDETGLFFSMAPDRTIASTQIQGVKQDKRRITLALTTNADGSEYISPLIIGHANKPRCFKKKSGKELGFNYISNKKAWMTALFFQDWLHEFNQKMSIQNRKVLLLLDNAPSHIAVEGEYSHVEVHMLPANTTSKLQPMDAGIIAAFKRRYRYRHMTNAIERDENGEIDIYTVDQLTAMKWSIEAWKDINSRIITNCWNHVNIIGDFISSEIKEVDLDKELENLAQKLPLRYRLSVEELVNLECEKIVDDILTEKQLLSDEFLIEQLECAQEIEVPEEADDVIIEKPIYSLTEKLSVITKAIEIVSDSDIFDPDIDSSLIGRLWKEKRYLNHIQQCSAAQKKITEYFINKN